MKSTVKVGLAVVIMGFIANILMGGGAAKSNEIAAMVKNGAVVIDVRSAGEFAGGHIDGAINIQHDLIERSIGSVVKGKNQAIIVYCHSGMRSAAAKKVLARLDYTQVVNGGGFHHMRNALGQ